MNPGGLDKIENKRMFPLLEEHRTKGHTFKTRDFSFKVEDFSTPRAVNLSNSPLKTIVDTELFNLR